MMKALIVVLALVLPSLLGYVSATSSIVVSPVAFVTDGEDGFEELGGPKGIATVAIGSSTYALVAAYDDDGFQVINITDPYNPGPVAAATDGEDGFEELGGARYVTAVTIGSSTYALVSASVDNGIQIINMTVPSSPVAVAHMSSAPGFYLQDPRGIATAVIGSSTYAVIAIHSGSVQIIDITDPSSPSQVAVVYGGSEFALSGARGVATAVIGSSTYALVAAHYDNAVQIIDITSPSSPSPVAVVRDSQDGMLWGATGVTTATIGSSTYALVTAQNDNAFQIINITSPSSPDLVAFAQDGSDGFDRLRYPESTAVVTFDSSTYAIVAAFMDGIQIINITDPSNPSPAASVDSNDARFGGFPFPEDIAVVTIDSRTYALAASYIGNGVPIIDVALTSGPLLTSAVLDEGTGILEIEFASAVDVTPAGMVDLSGLTIRGSGQSVSLAGATLGTEADSAAISIGLTEGQGRSVAAMASPRLDVADSAVTGTDGNPIERSLGNTVTVNDDAAPGVVSAVFDGEGSILTITFSDRIDVTPASMVYLGGMTVSGSGQSVSLAGATLGTEADSAAISIGLTEDQGRSIAAMTSPLLAMGRYDVVDTDGNPIESSSGNAITTVSTIVADTTAPTVTSIERSDPAEEAASVQTLVFSVTFSEDVTGVDRADFALSPDSTGAGSIANLTGSGSQYLVTVSATQDGTYNLDLVSSGHGITGDANNLLSSPTPTGADHTYTVSTIPADTTAPTVTSIERSDPAEATTSGRTLIFVVTFSEDVTGVDAGDFELDPDSTGGGSASGRFAQTSEPALRIADRSTIQDAITVDQSGTATSVSVAVDVTHTYIGDLVIDLIAPDGTAQTLHSRTGSSANDIDRTYTPDFDGTGITGDWTLRIRDHATHDTGTLNSWTLTIDHGGADSPVTGLTGSGSQYLVTVSATQDGTYNLDLVSSGHGITGDANNLLSSPTPTGADHTYTVSTIPADTTAPTVTSIERSDPAEATTSGRTLIFVVTFSEDVTGVDAGDFELDPDSTGGGSASGRFAQTSEPALRIADRSTIQDAITVDQSDTATSVSVAVDVTHTYIGDLVIDLIAPDGTAQTLHSRTGSSANDIDRTYTPDFDGTGITGDWTLRIRDHATHDTGTLNSWTLTIDHGGADSPVTGLTGSGSQYLVTVSATQDGTYNLDLVSSGHGITGDANNLLSSPTPTGADHTYTVSTIPADTTAPTVTSIERSDPAEATTSGRTLIFVVTFSEDVTGVDAGDFELDPDSTGGGSASGRFAQTSEPALRIADRSTIQDAITVDQSGTATSVSVAVDVTHTYIGDLVIDLIAPDGTAQTLHSRTGSSANDIDRTYTPDFDGTGITGDWTLRIRDHATHDTGTLNSWTLTIDHGGADSPVTGLTGSGSQYLVTVSATQDGTYNLDIVPNNDITDMAGNPLDGTGPTGEDQSYTVSTPAIQNAAANTPPSINAGPDQTVQGGQVVSLTGTATDVDGDPLTYSWSHDSALAIEFANSTAPSTTFTAPQVSSNTTFILTLTVDDGTQTASDSMSITTVETPESPRDIGEITLNSTTPGIIEASWEAPDEEPVNYHVSWAKVGESYLTWTDSAGNAFPTDPSRTIADLEEGETYKVKVRARYDGSAGDWSGEITITVARSANNPPTADAGTAQAVQGGDTVTLSGTASDQDGDQLTYSWSHDSALDISLANADSLSPAFTAPQVSANTTVTFTLTADDGTDTHSDTVTVTILDVPVVGTPNGRSDQNTTAVLNPDGSLGPRDIGRITLTSAQPGTIQASWEAPGETPVDYRISWAKAGEPYLTWTDLSGNAFPTDPSRTIADLEEGETYKVKVRARYDGSAGDWSGEITITVAGTG